MPKNVFSRVIIFVIVVYATIRFVSGVITWKSIQPPDYPKSVLDKESKIAQYAKERPQSVLAAEIIIIKCERTEKASSPSCNNRFFSLKDGEPKLLAQEVISQARMSIKQENSENRRTKFSYSILSHRNNEYALCSIEESALKNSSTGHTLIQLEKYLNDLNSAEIFFDVIPLNKGECNTEKLSLTATTAFEIYRSEIAVVKVACDLNPLT